MTATILRNSTFHLTYTGPVTVDLSCFAIALEITPNVETIDIGTFCNPSASTLGRVTYSALATLLWEPALYTVLQPHLNEQGLCAFAPDATKPLEYIKFTTRYSSQPWGRFELGQRGEVELPLAVIDVPLWLTGSLRDAKAIEDLVFPEVEPEAEAEPAEPEAA